MKIEDQVCTYDQSLRLKELGVIQKSLFFWQISLMGVQNECVFRIMYSSDRGPTSAFTVSELGIMLPPFVFVDPFCEDYNTIISALRVVGLKCPEIDKNNYKGEAYHRAETLIHLIETKAIAVDKINKALSQ